MPRKARFLAAALVVLGAIVVSVGVVALTRGVSDTAPSASVVDPGQVARPLRSESAAARAVPALALAEARRRLNLVTPARPTLAEDFTLPTLGGGEFRLREQRGKATLINFWATWCPPCLEEMPAMERLWQRHRAEGFVLLAVALDADPKKVGPFIAERKFTFPVALDPRMEVADKYGVRALPSSFLVDRAGGLSALALGPRAWDGDASHALIAAMVR